MLSQDRGIFFYTFCFYCNTTILFYFIYEKKIIFKLLKVIYFLIRGKKCMYC